MGGQAAPRNTGRLMNSVIPATWPSCIPAPVPSFPMASSTPAHFSDHVPEKPRSSLMYGPGRKGEWSLAADKCLRLSFPIVQSLLHRLTELTG